MKITKMTKIKIGDVYENLGERLGKNLELLKSIQP